MPTPVPINRPRSWPLLRAIAVVASVAAGAGAQAQLTFSALPADRAASCNFIPAAPTLTATTTCVTGGATVAFAQNRTDGPCTHAYSLRRVWTATDACGNLASHVQVVTVTDSQAPIIAGVPANVTVPATAVPPAPTASAVDFCDAAPSLTEVLDSIAGACGAYSLVRLYTAADACGNTRTRRYVVTVTGNSSTPPVITGVTPGGNLACGGGLPGLPNVIATDDGGTPLLNLVVDTLTGLGGDTCRVVRRTWTATDNCGLQTSAQQRFVFIDGLGPTLSGIPANAIVYCTTLPPPPALYTVIRASDPCDPNPTIRYEERSEQSADGTCTDVNYRVIRTWTAVDACGNETSRSQTLEMKCECCDNGVDDDGDGLIDDYDPQCNCFAGVEAACDSMKRYYIPPVWQPSNPQYNAPSQLVVTTLAPLATFTAETADGSYYRTFTVRKGTPLIIDLTVNQLQTPNHDRVERNRGWILTSDQLIQPIFRIDGFYNKDIATIKGPQALGRVFRAASQTSNCGPNSMQNGEGHFISVIATEDGTEVTVRMTFPGLNGLNGVVTRRLNRHETWLIRDDASNTTVSGSLVTATKPIAVISGSQHTKACEIGTTTVAQGMDAGFDQLVPNCLTGDEYVMVRGKQNAVQQYAILVANKHDTRIIVDGNPASEIVLQAGEYREFRLSGADYVPRHFKANKPFYAYQVAGISSNNEVGMAICAPVGACKGDTLIEFPKFDGNSEGKLVDNTVYVIIPQAGLASLQINGQGYGACATPRAVPARPDLAVVVFENDCIRGVNSITSDERFTAGMLVGIDQNTGLHGYLTSFKDRMEVRDPRSGRVSTAYFVDTLCGRSQSTHCIDVTSCATAHTIAAVHPQHGTVTLDGVTCFTYHSPDRYQGLDEVLVTIQNDQGLFQTVCLSYYICASPPVVTFNFVDTTVACDQVPPLEPPIMADECGMRIQFDHEDSRDDGECAYSYVINRHWTFWDDCDDSTRFTQVIRVRDTAAPIAIGIPSDTLIAACAGVPPPPTVTYRENCDNSFQYAYREETVDSTCVYERTIVRTWEAWDNCGNRSTAVQRIELRDTSAPVMSPVPPLIVLGCGQGDVTPVVTVRDDCDPRPLLVLDSVSYATTCDTLRHVLRRWTATDACGRVSTATQRVVVLDQGPPVALSVPRDTSIVCGQPLPTAAPRFIDDCTSPVPVYSVDSSTVAACPVLSRIYRTWTAVDACGHVVTARQIISVVDTTGPVFLPLPDTIFASCADSVVVVQPQVLDDCGFTMTSTDSMASGPGCNGERLLYRSYTIADACGRSAEHTQLYYFRDTVPPYWLQQPHDVTLSCTDPIPAVIDPNVADVCSGYNPIAVVIRDSSRVCPATRWIIRDYTVSDWCGNLSRFTHRITIIGCEPVSPVLATGVASCTGEDLVLRVTVDSGYSTPVYQWLYSRDGVNWSNLGQPSDSSSLTFANADPSRDGYYRVNVADAIADLGTQDCSSLSNAFPLAVRPHVASVEEVDLCRGDTLFYLGDALTASVTRVDTLATWYGCDSVATLRLNVFPYVEIRVDTTLCFGESLSLLGETYVASGTYRDTLLTTHGCDSTLELRLRVLPDLRDTFRYSLCAGDSYAFEGRTLTAPGLYAAALTSSTGCDSSRVVRLTVLDTAYATIDTTICWGGSVTIAGERFAASGHYRRVLRAASGCDSVVTLDLDVVTPTTTVVDAHVCAGEVYHFGDRRLDRAGIYTRVLPNRYGCDSTIELRLRLAPRFDTEVRAELCEGEVYTNQGYVLTRAGRWPLQFYTADGCDSVVNVTLVYRRHRAVEVAETICLGDRYTLLDTTLTTAGTYVRTGRNRYGCDSTVTLRLGIESPQRTVVRETICFGDSLRAASRVFSATSRDSFLLTSRNGCDSLVVVDLTVLPNRSVDTTAAICFGESLRVNGLTFTTPGIYRYTAPDRNGCDSTWSLTLSVFAEQRDTVRRAICAGDTLRYGGQTFAAAGDYAFTFLAANACDSVIVLELEVLDTNRTALSVDICQGERYRFGTRDLVEAGFYVDTLSNRRGCDSIVELRLRVNPRFEQRIDTTLCEGESVFFAGRHRDLVGTYGDTLVTVTGCDSVVILRLDFFPTAAGFDTVHLCEGEGVDLDGGYVTTPGTYAASYLSAEGCDSTHTTRVFVHPLPTTRDTALICHDGYFVFAGDTLRAGGSYVAELQSYRGCDSTAILELIVTDAVRLASDDARICAGSSVQLQARGYRGPVTWSPSVALSCTTCPNPVASPLETTVYTVSARDCSGSLVEAQATVTVLQPVDVKIVSARKLRLGESTTLRAVTNDPNASTRWRQGSEVLCDACDEVVVQPLETTIYEVDATNGSGCDDTERLTLIVEDECSFADIQIPNILTPNGDGANDLFEIRYAGIEEIILLRIYNRWGEVVYETRDIEVFWDGTHRGMPVNPGVYVYYMEGYCLNSEKFSEQGNVTVVR